MLLGWGYRLHRESQQKVNYVNGFCKKKTWFLWLPIKHFVTKHRFPFVVYNARTMSRGAHLGFRKLQFHLHPRLQRVLFHSCKSYSQPSIKKKKGKNPSDASLWVSANEIRNIFQRRLFSPRMSPPVALSLVILFFMGLILNAGIKEASKSWGEADVWWGWHRWNEAHFSTGQPTLLFSKCLWAAVNTASGHRIQRVAILNK